MEKGSEGHTLHGSSGPGFDPHQSAPLPAAAPRARAAAAALCPP